MSEGKVKQLAIKNITADPLLQMRDKGLNEAVVDEYAEAMKAGADFPPLVVYHDTTGTNWLSEGFHRFAAAQKAGLKVVTAEMRGGTRKDAVAFAAGSNATHGLKRTNADKRRAVERMTAEFPEWSSRDIADAVKVSHSYVCNVRKDIEKAAGAVNVYSQEPEQTGGDSEQVAVSQDDGEELHAQQSHAPTGGESSARDEDDGEPQVVLSHADADKAYGVVKSALRHAHRIQEELSGLLTGTFSQELRNFAESCTGCKFYDTGETIQQTFHGGTTIGTPKFSNDSLDNLFTFFGGAKQMLARIEARPVGDDGEKAAPWEKADFDAVLRRDDDVIPI